MAIRAWLAPALVGLAVAVLTAAIGPRIIDTAPAPLAQWEVEAQRGYVWPFQGAAGDNATFLLVAPHGRANAEETLPNASRNLQWLSPNLATYTSIPSRGQPDVEHTGTGIGASDAGMSRAYPVVWSPPCCAASQDGTVRVTAYVFLESGALLASNAPAADVARFRLDGYYSALPAGNWTMGTTVRGPDGLAFGAEWQPVLGSLRAGVEAAAVGGVVTAVVAQHPHASALGPLYVTLRVDARST